MMLILICGVVLFVALDYLEGKEKAKGGEHDVRRKKNRA